ncbi:unnamed protein product [Moneuplotes crassus]|uniref:Uncharacterized protein n=1 Tax=Euplotes crassus TaxID=5936 RepID=A0AAD1XQC2_EUPCR|nr:unnamed protein product [Moneuplotes crassus]
MTRICIILLTFLIGSPLVACYGGPLKYFRYPPYHDFDQTAFNLERIHNIALKFVSLFKMIEVGIESFNSTLTKDALINLWPLFLETFFHCKNWDCITLVDVMVGGFDEYRHFAMLVMTEMDYEYNYLWILYSKKKLNIIKKIVNERGNEVFVDKSKCIRQRIDRYYMPMFKVNDTSSCTEFDDIIVSFSEQPFEDKSPFYYLAFNMVIFIVLAVITFVVSKLLKAEWRTFLKQEDILAQMRKLRVINKPHYKEDQLRIINMPHNRDCEGVLDFNNARAEHQKNEASMSKISSDSSAKAKGLLLDSSR